MKWFVDKPFWFEQELYDLSHSSNYIEICTSVDETLVTSGEIIVRSKQTHRFPILIVYPKAFPFEVPKIILLKEPIRPDLVKHLAGCTITEIINAVKDQVEFYYRRHQNSDGSLCILEKDDLHDDSAQLVGAKAVIDRVHKWCRGIINGNFPMDSREVELYAHFPKKDDTTIFIVPDEFYIIDILHGKFYFSESYWLPKDRNYGPKYFYGLGINGINASGIYLDSLVDKSKSYFLNSGLPDHMDLAMRNEAMLDLIRNDKLIEGWWIQIDFEPQPFENMKKFIDSVGWEQFVPMMDKDFCKKLKNADEQIYFAIRFPNRRGKNEWQFFILKKIKETPALLQDIQIEEAKQRLLERDIIAIQSFELTDSYFHLRNSTRANRSILQDKSITVIGCGALGSITAESLGKAGIGRITLVDKEVLKPHNAVRHSCGLDCSGWPKVMAVAINSIALHNPFITINTMPIDIMENSIDTYFPYESVGISTIADDTIEAYLNEQCIKSNRSVYYARALRGGKAARIFRVKPGNDACKQCLSLYKAEKNPLFIDLPEDVDFPEITNECNNPIRPASAADLHIISGVLSRIIIEDHQGTPDEHNHYIWYTENLPDLHKVDNLLGGVHKSYIPPHPKCHLCQRIEPKEVLISVESITMMRLEAKSSGSLETGGVLMGFRNAEGSLVVVRATGPGPKAVRSATLFEKDIEYCQNELNHAIQAFGNRGIYIGEWHYHPIGTNQPSGTDIRSLSEIANQHNYLTNEPLMIIISNDMEMAFTVHPANKGYTQTNYREISDEEVFGLDYQTV